MYHSSPLASAAIQSLILAAATIPLSLLVGDTHPAIAFAGVFGLMFALRVRYPDL